MGKTMELARQIAANDPRMIAGIKRLVLSNLGTGWEEMYRAELEAQRGELSPTPIAEGFKDFLDRKGRS